jgi:hypothetical protein
MAHQNRKGTLQAMLMLTQVTIGALSVDLQPAYAGEQAHLAFLT